MSVTVQTRYRVTGMDCGACAAKVEAAVSRLPGVATVSASATAGTMTVTHATDPTLLPAMRASLLPLGYQIAPAEPSPAVAGLSAPHRHADDDERPWWRTRKGLTTIACGLALAVAWAAGRLIPAVGWWVFLAAVAVGLVPVARRAFAAARAGSPLSIEMLMTVAAVGAVLIGAAEEAAMVVFLFLVGELLEGVAAARARAGIRGLAALTPQSALVERDGCIEPVPVQSLGVGAVILVRPGDRIAADGIVVEGDAAVDESPVTGESMPVRKVPGARVFAGSIDIDAALRVRMTAAAADNTIARVVRLVEEAQEAKAPTERLIDRFSRHYTPAVVAVAAVVAVTPPIVAGAAWSEWIYKGLALLLIGCPCALVISTPAAIAAALSAGARHGLLVKGGAVLETLGRITHAALDKTGTLTEGKPKVTDVVGFGRDARQVLSMAAALETGSNHPLALAILDRAKADRVPAPPAVDVKAAPGKGVAGRLGGERLFLGAAQAAAGFVALGEETSVRIAALEQQGKTVSVLLAGDAVAGLIALRDEPRPDARAGVDALKSAGVAPVMLTGDNHHAAAAIAADLGIVAWGGLLPEDKLRIVRDLQQQGRLVAKVGDGINDAPALAAADVGIAMGGGADIALETADAAVLNGRVMDVARMIALSRAAMANIRQNITIALGLKAVFLVTTIIGITGLWPAILADTGATMLVTANAMRLLGWRT